MQTLSIAAATTTIDFAQARKQAIAKASETLTEPVIVAWKDGTTGKSAPAIPGGSADRWHDYGENNDGTLEMKVGDDFHFIFTESSAFDRPDMNLTSLEDNGTKFLCLNGACTEADRQGQGYFAGGGLGG